MCVLLIACSCVPKESSVVFYSTYTPGVSSPVSRTEEFVTNNFEPIVLKGSKNVTRIDDKLKSLEVNHCSDYTRSVEPVLIAYTDIDGAKSKIVFDGYTLNINNELFCVDTSLTNIFFTKSSVRFDYSQSCLCLD